MAITIHKGISHRKGSLPKVRYALAALIVGLVLSGCRSSGAVKALGETPTATPAASVPTMMPLFGVTGAQADTASTGPSLDLSPSSGGSQSGASALFQPSFGGPETPTPEAPGLLPTVTPSATPATTSVSPPLEYVEVVVYDDKVDPNWSLEASDKVVYDPFDTSHWFTAIHDDLNSGAVSLAVTPLADYSTLFFTVKPGAAVAYPRDKVVGLSLWVNSGSAILDTDDLAVTVVGSNELAYWSPDDHSVFPDSLSTFSETRLYYLGLNRSIPPDTWVQIILWLDDLLYDPLYANVTGFYLKTVADFESTFYVDNVSLLMLP